MSILAVAGDFSPFSAFKVMRLIYVTARQAKVHREICLEFATYLGILHNLLAPLEASPQLMELPAVRDTLVLLHKSLLKALLLIQKCEQTSTLTALVKHVPRQLKELEGELQRALSLLNLANLYVNLKINGDASVETSMLASAPPIEDLNKGLDRKAVSGPNLGLSPSFKQSHISHDDIPIRSLSVPSTSSDDLEIYHGISAKELTITWGGDERYWTWVPRPGSRFNEVAYLSEVYWLEVQGQLNTRKLKPGTYTVSWRLQVGCLEDDRKPSGWDLEPVVFKISSDDGSKEKEQGIFLGGGSGKKSNSDLETLAQLDTKSLDSVHQNGHGKEHASEWTEYDVGTFTVDKRHGSTDVIFSMSELNGGWKRGLFVDGIFITPSSGLDNVKISFDTIVSTKGSEELPTLPQNVLFSGHRHDLKLLQDPYWFTCDVCEIDEHGIGYRCKPCSYNVHPHCCISDHHFSTLLDLTDSEHSHWNWTSLLELNKHRTEAKASRPKTVGFARHPHPLKLTQFPYPSFICDNQYCDGCGWVYRGWDGWVYHCAECDLTIHPECRFVG